MAAVKSTWVALLLLVACAAATAPAGSFGGFHRISAASSRPSTSSIIHNFRGGASEYDSDEYDESEYDSDEEEPIVRTAKKLAASTKTVVANKKKAAVKAKVKVAMASSSSATKSVAKKSGGGNLYKRYVPYIIRACLNPFTLLAMTKAYFVSLCDINYLKEEQSQTLRSALEEKARTQAASGPTKPKRKMKPGQAKTLSDLPQLSA